MIKFTLEIIKELRLFYKYTQIELFLYYTNDVTNIGNTTKTIPSGSAVNE